jgi:uncharacterized protein (TIGR02145 family)
MMHIIRSSALVILMFLANFCDTEEDSGIKDGDGNTYSSIRIGAQEWLTENLRTTRYSNGDLIGTTNPSDHNLYNESTPKYQWAYAGQDSNASVYGRLYTWYTAMDTRNVCPAGWHVPTESEWIRLENYLIANGHNYDGTTTGNKIAKSLAAKTNWESSYYTGAVGNADYPGKRNSSGFTALPGGYRFDDGLFDGLGSHGNWWSSTETGSLFARCFYIYCNYFNTYRGDDLKKGGFSIRCVKDSL